MNVGFSAELAISYLTDLDSTRRGYKRHRALCLFSLSLFSPPSSSFPISLAMVSSFAVLPRTILFSERAPLVLQVLVNTFKYSCEPCINGHRSSSCTHTLRPLYEVSFFHGWTAKDLIRWWIQVRSKGRPPSQCKQCRDARKLNRRHVRCQCDGSQEVQAATHNLVDPRYATPKSQLTESIYAYLGPHLPSPQAHHRLRTNIPALPNGLRDIVEMQQSDTTQPPSKKQRRKSEPFTTCTADGSS